MVSEVRPRQLLNGDLFGQPDALVSPCLLLYSISRRAIDDSGALSKSGHGVDQLRSSLGVEIGAFGTETRDPVQGHSDALCTTKERDLNAFARKPGRSRLPLLRLFLNI